MFGGRSWHKVPGDSQFSAYWVPDEGWCYKHSDDPLPELAQQQLVNVPHDEEAIFTVDWLSSGYYNPGVSSGPVERSYPSEGEDERVLGDVITVEIGNTTIKLSPEASKELFDDVLEDVIMKTDSGEYEPDDFYNESYFNKALNKILLS